MTVYTGVTVLNIKQRNRYRVNVHLSPVTTVFIPIPGIRRVYKHGASEIEKNVLQIY